MGWKANEVKAKERQSSDLKICQRNEREKMGTRGGGREEGHEFGVAKSRRNALRVYLFRVLNFHFNELKMVDFTK